MPDPILTYGAKVLTKGYRVYGDVRSGLQATVPYLLTWDNAFLFASAVINPVNAVRAGLITFSLPYRLPTTATPVYAQGFDIAPCGLDPELNVSTVLPYHGLAPGEFFSHAVVTVQFQQLQWSFGQSEDPDGLMQLDPSNPIYFCEQSVKIGGKMVTRKGLNYVYSDTNKPVVGDVGVLVPEAKLVLKFPRVPYLPWQLLVPYVGKVNSGPMFECDPGTLLLESPDTQAKASLGGAAVVECAVTLEFAYDPGGWNTLPHPDGTTSTVHLKGDSSRGIYEAADFREIFDQLQFAGT